jgi:hypothetical protein
MFAQCGNRTRDLLRIRGVFPPLRHISRHYYFVHKERKERKKERKTFIEYFFRIIE